MDINSVVEVIMPCIIIASMNSILRLEPLLQM